MTLSVLFNFSPADKRDPQSRDDCELLDIKLDDETLPLYAENDLALNRHLLAALYRLHQIMPR
jgi:hypothetical protein